MTSTASSTMAAEWNITSMKKCTLNARGVMLSPTNIPLDGIVAYDIEIETISSVNKKRRKNTLYGVPLFLIEAFTWLEKNKALDVEGIFRKPGSVKKLRHQWQVFCGLARIPDWPDFSVHDVCTLIMRFFSVINKPILAEQQNQILSTVAAIENEKVQVEAVFTFIDQLPPVNKATLGFLMRQLKKIADHPEHTQMSDANLAICFAPAIFNDNHSQEPRHYSLTAPSSLLSTSIWSNSSNSFVDGAAGRLVGRSLQTIGNCRKKKAGEALQQESLREIDFAKRRKDLQASVIKLLIQYADRICDGSRRSPATSLLHRKSSDLQFLRSPIAIASDQGQKTTNMKSRENEERKGRSRVPSFRSDKIWPRSASENPFNRIALFSFPFGKNGSFAPKESSTGKGQTHNTPKVQQSRPTIPFHSPSN